MSVCSLCSVSLDSFGSISDVGVAVMSELECPLCELLKLNLTNRMLHEGRQLIVGGDYPAFAAWVERTNYVPDPAVMEQTMKLCIGGGDSALALRLFDSVWVRHAIEARDIVAKIEGCFPAVSEGHHA